jgi:sulfatase maturation enzyme AslB (radical SAM superfamily)
MSETYFLLNREVMLQKGKNNYAIYNLFTGDMVSLNHDIGIILELTEKGRSLEEVSRQLEKELESIFIILKSLDDAQVGNFYPSKIYIEKYKLGSPYDAHSFTKPAFHICFIELPSECSLDCPFCGYPTLFPCSTCTKVRGNADISKVKLFLHRVIQADCKNLIFHGGDPLCCLDQLITAVEYCRKLGFEGGISVITNGSQINRNTTELFSQYKIQPIIPVFLTSCISQESYLTGFSNLSRQYGVPFTITTVYLEEEEIDVLRLKEKIVEMKPDRNQIAVIYNKIRDTGENTYTQLLKTPRRVDANTYYHMKYHHPCLYSVISMSVTGDIFPCPYMKKEVLGNIQDSYWLERMFENESIYDYWDLPLSSIDNCRNCAFQLGCLDCRAIEMWITDDLYGKQLCSLGKKDQV